jgi:hypothetical protein
MMSRGRDSTVRQGVPFLDRSRIERILTCCGLAWLNAQCLLVVVSGGSFGISLLDASTRMMLFFSLYIISNRLCFLRSCKVVHSSCSIMLLTDEVLWYRLVTYRAALLWTISNRWMSFCWYGSHSELAYSWVGLTRDTYVFSLIDLLEMFMFLLRKLMVLFALEQMVLICLPHLRSDEMVHPRYFADVSCARICPCSV